MPTILEVLLANEAIIFFLYGQVFFVLGLAVALQSREARRRSQLPLAGALGWLAWFGFTHALHEWGDLFVPIQAGFLTPSVITLLRAAQWGLLAASFLLLAQFGLLLTVPPTPWRPALRLAPALVLVALLLVVLAPDARLDDPDLARLYLWTRHILVLPSAALAAWGVLRQAHLVDTLTPRHLAGHFRLAAVSLGAYSLFAAVAVPTETLPGTSESELVAGLFSVLALRSLAGLGIAVGIIRGLEVFDVETNRLLAQGERRQLTERMQRLLLKRVIAAQEDERRRVARELHDDTGQHLTAVIMAVGTAQEVLQRDPGQAWSVLDEARELATRSLQGVRELILGLRPSSLDDFGLVSALRRLVDDLSRRTGLEIRVDGDALTRRLPTEVETTLFRILQEGLNNVARHAAARHVTLHLSLIGTEVQAVLEDDGVGFDVAQVEPPEGGHRLGLLGMHERASLLGGEVVVTSTAGRGTRLCVRLPVDQAVGQAVGGTFDELTTAVDQPGGPARR